ncbi:MAG: pyrroline-5-carboxylate reductase [Rhodospirillaceae bacterium]|nr:pyrroline-5-carboxylate reductase [Rhodospirillaceae bacterium]
MDLAAARLMLVGCGKMGTALLCGWIAGGANPANVIVVEPSKDAMAAFADDRCAPFVERPENVPDTFHPDVIILAVKPQLMGAVAPAYTRYSNTGVVFLSIAAGTTIGFLEKALSAAAPIIRSMPNTPAAVGRGVTAAICNAYVRQPHRVLCEQLLRSIGDVVWITDEADIDAVTAVSGSGPAYVFHLVEAMTTAGIAEGLSPEVASRLARATVAGAGELLHQSPESASTLRDNVTSRRGTTAAALEVLMADNGLSALVKRAVAAAANRSRELGV